LSHTCDSLPSTTGKKRRYGGMMRRGLGDGMRKNVVGSSGSSRFRKNRRRIGRRGKTRELVNQALSVTGCTLIS